MSYSIVFNLRPVKVAYFIDDDDCNAFTEIAHFCSTQWGGINNFIIPISAGGVSSYFRYILKAREPDTLVSACTTQSIRLDEFHQRHLPNLNIHTWRQFKAYDETAHPLSVYQPAMPSEHLTIYTASSSTDPIERACGMAAFGQIWPEQEEDYRRTFWLDSVDPNADNDQFCLKQQMARDLLTSPLNLTGMRVAIQYSQNMPNKLHFDVVVPNNVWDLCLFWNLRAIENVGTPSSFDSVRRTLIVPLRLFVKARFRRFLFMTIRPTLINPFRSSTLDVNFLTGGTRAQKRRVWTAIRRSEQENAIQPLNGQVSTTRHSGQPRADFGHDRHAKGEPLIYMFNMPPWLPDTYRESADSVAVRGVDLHNGVSELYSPAHTTRFSGFGEIMLDIQSDYWTRYPCHPAVAAGIVQGATFTDYGLSGHVMSQSGETLHRLNIISEQQALDAFFGANGYQTRREVVYQQAETLIDLMGGIDGCDYLRGGIVLQILDKLAIKTTNKLSQDIARHVFGQAHLRNVTAQQRDEVFELVRQAVAEADIAVAIQRVPTTVEALRATPELRNAWGDIVHILDHLVRHQIVFRGFQVKCDRCGTPTWHAFNVAEETIQCPGCFYRFPLSVAVDGGRERPWEYTLNTAVNRAMDQDVLTPVLLLAKLAKEKHPIYCQTIGLKLRTATNPDIGDFDVVYVKDQRLYAAECKTGGELKQKDIDLAQLAYDIGCAGFFFASRTAFNQDALALIATFQKKVAAQDKPFDVTVYQESDLLVSR